MGSANNRWPFLSASGYKLHQPVSAAWARPTGHAVQNHTVCLGKTDRPSRMSGSHMTAPLCSTEDLPDVGTDSDAKVLFVHGSKDHTIKRPSLTLVFKGREKVSLGTQVGLQALSCFKS